MGEPKFRGTPVTLDDGRVLVVPKIPVAVQRDNIALIKAASDAATGMAKSITDPDIYEKSLDALVKMATAALLAVHLNHPDVSLDDLLATCSDETITELYAATWKRRGGQDKGEAGSPSQT